MNRFDKYVPSDRLRPYVKCFVVSEMVQEHTYKVLPSTSLVLGFQYRGSLVHVTDGAEQHLATAGITGLQDRFRVFRNTANIGTILIYFTETGASAFVNNPVNDLFSASLSLDHFIVSSPLNTIQEQLAQSQTDKQRIDLVEQFLVAQLQPTPADLPVTAAVQHIYRAKGAVRIRHLAEQLHTSQSPLEKRFRRLVGASPKKFASIVRLQAVIDGYSPSVNLTATAHHNGYFDQSHFIKDFKLFTGETPEKFFNK